MAKLKKNTNTQNPVQSKPQAEVRDGDYFELTLLDHHKYLMVAFGIICLCMIYVPVTTGRWMLLAGDLLAAAFFFSSSMKKVTVDHGTITCKMAFWITYTCKVEEIKKARTKKKQYFTIDGEKVGIPEVYCYGKQENVLFSASTWGRMKNTDRLVAYLKRKGVVIEGRL